MAKDPAVERMKKAVRYFGELGTLLDEADKASERAFIQERAQELANRKPAAPAVAGE